MAERNSTSNARSGRKLSEAAGQRELRAHHERDPHESGADATPSENPIETERRRLMRAETVLGCISFALTYADWREAEGTDYADAVDVARKLVRESIEALDRVRPRSSREEGSQSQP